MIFKKKQTENNEVFIDSKLKNNVKLFIKQYLNIHFDYVPFQRLSQKYITELVTDIFLILYKNKNKKIYIDIIENKVKTSLTILELSKKLYCDPIKIVKFFFILDKEKQYLFKDYILINDIKILSKIQNIFFFNIVKIKKKNNNVLLLKKNHKNTITRALNLVVCGHINHGKTSIISQLLNINTILKKEIKNITQRIGLYSFSIEKNNFVIIDTPGHNIFTEFRELAIRLSDIVLLVIDIKVGIQEETIQCIKLWQKYSQDLFLLVIFNKIDLLLNNKIESRIHYIKTKLYELGIQETNNVEFIKYSIKQKITLSNLKKNLIFFNELLQPKICQSNINTEFYGKIVLMEKDDKTKTVLLYILLDKIILKKEDRDKVLFLNLLKYQKYFKIQKKQYIFNNFMLVWINKINLNYINDNEEVSLTLKLKEKYQLSQSKDVVILNENLNNINNKIPIFIIFEDLNFVLLLDKIFKEYKFLSCIGYCVSLFSEYKNFLLKMLPKNTIFIIFEEKNKISSSGQKIFCKINFKKKFINTIYDLLNFLNEENSKQQPIEYNKSGISKVKAIFNIHKQIIYGCDWISGFVTLQSKIKFNGKWVDIKSLQIKKTTVNEWHKKNSEIGIVFKNNSMTFNIGDQIIFYEKKK